jgi:hypothetical protein
MKPGHVLLLVLSTLSRSSDLSIATQPMPELAQLRESPQLHTLGGEPAEQALTERVDTPSGAVPSMVLGSALPKTPLPGQKKPPCVPRSEVEIRGVCWARLDIEPPCGSAYEHEGRCYIAIYTLAPVPISEEPR